MVQVIGSLSFQRARKNRCGEVAVFFLPWVSSIRVRKNRKVHTLSKRRSSLFRARKNRIRSSASIPGKSLFRARAEEPHGEYGKTWNRRDDLRKEPVTRIIPIRVMHVMEPFDDEPAGPGFNSAHG
jgi:hypothetical protein